MFPSGLAGMHPRHHVDGHACGPPRLIIRVAEPGGVVHQDIDPAQGACGLGDIPPDSGGIRQVADRDMALRPKRSISRRAASSASAPRAQIETPAPAWAKPRAIERPMPRLPPHTMARLPAKSISMPFLPRLLLDWARVTPRATP